MPAAISNRLIISDTSCLIAFSNIGRFDILHDLCQSIAVTSEVAAEFLYPLPEWIQIIKVKDDSKIKSISAFLGLGESSVIALALETKNSIVILDDKKARHYAQNMGLDVIGMLGLLVQAYEKGIIADLKPILEKLQSNGFRMPPITL
jgi:predicted nucleic acid-binding protein